MLLDLDVDAELAERLMKAGVKVRDPDTVRTFERAAAAVVRPDEQRVVDEVEVDLEGCAVVTQTPGCDPRTST
jgi:hypothetical protein